MEDLSFVEMQNIQKELREKYKDKWERLTPELSKDYLLWLMIEVGEAADILKKEGYELVMSDPDTRRRYVEELVDVMMYFNDSMICCGITTEELRQVYLEKHRKNMSRW